MKLSIVRTALVLVAIPALAGAARAADPAFRARRDTPAMQGESQLARKTIEKYDPVRLLIDKRKELKLSDKQRAELETMDEPVKWNIKKLAARVDSAQRGIGNARGGMRGGRGRGVSQEDDPIRSPEESRERMLADRKIILDAIVDLQREMELRTDEALKAMTAEQRPLAADLIKKRAAEINKILDESGYLNPLKSQRGGGGRTGQR